MQPTKVLSRTPSHDQHLENDADTFVNDADASGYGRSSRIAALCRLSLANRENNANVGILELVEQLQQQPEQAENHIGCGVDVSTMQAALAALPSAHKLAGKETSVAQALDQALEAEMLCAPDVAPRGAARKLSINSRLQRLEQSYQRQLMPVNQVQRITRELQKHRERLQAKFAEWDLDGDGQITKHELVEVMRSLGLEVFPGEVNAFFAEYDPDGSGALDLKEFYGVAYSGGTR